MKLAAYNNTNAALLFIPLILYFEGDVLSEYSYLLTSWYYWFLMTVGGVCGFAIGIVTMLQIQVCPAVPPPVRVRVWVCVDVGVWLSCGRASGDVTADAQHLRYRQGGPADRDRTAVLPQPRYRGQYRWKCASHWRLCCVRCCQEP